MDTATKIKRSQKPVLHETAFYHKKQTKTFTYEEVAKISDLLEDETMENRYLLELAKSEMVEDDDEEDGTGDELIAMLRR